MQIRGKKDYSDSQKIPKGTKTIDLMIAKAIVNDNNKKSLFKDILFCETNSGGKINQWCIKFGKVISLGIVYYLVT